MKTKLTAQLRRDEGEVLYAYQDSLSYLTIGVGRLIDKRKGGGITHEESDYLLSNDIDKREAELLRRAPWMANLDAARFGALVNIAFQMGVDGLLGFTNTLALLRAGDYPGAAAGMLKSKWAGQTPERAQRIAQQIIKGEWQ